MGVSSRISIVLIGLALTLLAGCRPSGRVGTPPSEARSLFDGKTLTSWTPTDFAGTPGQPRVENGELILPQGADMTGVTWAGSPIPTADYEISLQAKRTGGNDFFCGLTFPVGSSHASFIVGGWGGELCGISSLDGDDAANNETGTNKTFELNRWYTIVVRVRPNRIETRIDGEVIVDVDITSRKVGVRWEIESSCPLGIATWRTSGAVRNIQLRPLPPL